MFNTLAHHIERRYGIPVVISDVPYPFTGDLDGAEIQVDYEENAESALFIIVHLFGHTVQWNLSERARELGSAVQKNPTEEKMRELHDYETEACRYSLQLLHEAGVRDLDQWLSDFAACDFAYLSHLYRTGERQAFRTFWRDGEPLLTPLPIPEFKPTRWLSRSTGTVL